jgi:hypothetical protein
MSKASASCSSCPNASSDTVAQTKAVKANNKIILELEDELSSNSDTNIKIKKVKKFLEYDLKQYQVVGHVDSYINSKNDKNGSHHSLSFFIQEKKNPKKVSKLVIDFLINENSANKCDTPGCKKAVPGVVSSAAPLAVNPSNPSKTKADGNTIKPGDAAKLKTDADFIIVNFYNLHVA